MKRVLLFLLLILAVASPAAALTNSECMDCHSDDTLTKTVDGKEVSLFVDEELFNASIHGENGYGCLDCHEGLEKFKDEHPAVLPKVQCASCHEDTADEMKGNAHDPVTAQADTDLPGCADCHGAHDVLPKDNLRSRVFPLNIPATCCRCHSGPEVASRHPNLSSAVCADYEAGMHGLVLIKSGLVFSAVCNDCHGSHDMLPTEDPDSRVSWKNVNKTCGTCHSGVLTTYEASIHGQIFAKGEAGQGEPKAPTCASCHGSHRTERAMDPMWMVTVARQCEGCHKEAADTFRDTYHGQVTGLGYSEVAQCSDCHGAHNILPKEDPASMISEQNLVATCAACHPGANASFTTYFPHANYHDRDRYPIFYWFFFAMVVLLGGTFAAFGIHTALWLVRSYIEKIKG